MISIEDFKNIDLRVAKILEAEKIENSDNLLKLTLDLGNETRQIISGIAQYYKPQDLINKEIVMVYNLEPRIIKGIESQGMLLAAKDENNLGLLILDKEIKPGTKIS
jgi:methionyl-tRNA synthetase